MAEVHEAPGASHPPNPVARASGSRGMEFPVAVAGLLLLALLLGARGLDSPGLYYDEAVQARPALEFASGRIRASELPGSQSIWLGNRRFPLMTQPYMGALKSQALIPGFWLVGSQVEVLRLTTLLWALIGLAFVAAFSRRVFGGATALAATALLCCDPSFLLLARHDWGSFSLSFLLRGVVLWCGWSWWQSRRSGWLWTAAFAAGLAFYNKVDIAIFASAVGLALLAVAGKRLRAAWREEPRAGRTLAVAAGAFLLGLAPMIPAIGAVFAARNAFAQPNELAEKLQTLLAMADGSYFYRLMSTGGVFGADALGEVANAPGSVFPFALALAVAWLVFRVAAAPAGGRDSRALFLLLASGLSILAVIALPGAVRIHHAMNTYPLLHLLLAYALVDAVRAASSAKVPTGTLESPTRVPTQVPTRVGLGGAPRSPRARVAALTMTAIGLFVLSTHYLTYERTHSELQRNGGKGRWSRAIHAFAAELDAEFEGSVLSLDWGFHEPLAFLAQGGALREAHWQIPRSIRQRGEWRFRGESGDRYILHLPPYDRAGFGRPFLDAVERLNSELVVVQRHLDGDGDIAFVTVRVNAPHELSFEAGSTGRGEFRIGLFP